MFGKKKDENAERVQAELARIQGLLRKEYRLRVEAEGVAAHQTQLNKELSCTVARVTSALDSLSSAYAARVK